MNILTVTHLFTFLREGTMNAEFNSIILCTVLYLRFQHCAKDVSKVTAQHTILESCVTIMNSSNINTASTMNFS